MAEKDRGRIHDAPMESVTTAGEDFLPHENSAMESATTDDPWNQNINPDSLMSMMSVGEFGSEAQGHGAQALAAARAHLQAVAEELATIQSQFDNSIKSDAAVSPSDAPDMKEREPSQAALLIQSKQELERDKRHLEVDLECANARADRLAHEKEELLGAQARLEDELRSVRKQLEDARLDRQHRDMENRKNGEEPLGPLPDSPLGVSSEKIPTALHRDVIEQAGIAPKPANTMSKQQAVAALRTARADLLEERKRRERLERRVQKDKERLERLVAVAEQQQMDIKTLETRCYESEVTAEECLGRLQESVAHSEALKMALQGPRPASKGSNLLSEPGSSRLGTPLDGRRAHTPNSMLRQQSAPTRLPTVVNTGSKWG